MFNIDIYMRLVVQNLVIICYASEGNILNINIQVLNIKIQVHAQVRHNAAVH